MSDKQALLAVIRALPDDATWAEIIDHVVPVLARFRARDEAPPVAAPDGIVADDGSVGPDAVVFAKLPGRL